MDAKNLAIVFSPVVFGEEEVPQGDLLNVQPAKVCQFPDAGLLLLTGAGLCDGGPD